MYEKKALRKLLTLTAAFHVIFLSSVSRFVTHAVVYINWVSTLVIGDSTITENHLPATLIKSPENMTVLLVVTDSFHNDQ